MVLALRTRELWSDHEPAYRLAEIRSARPRLRPNWCRV